MNEAMEWIKQHPYATGGIVLVGGVFVLIMRSGGGSSSGPSAAAYQASAQVAAVNSAASIQAMSIQAAQNVEMAKAQVANNALAAELAATKYSYDATTTQQKQVLEYQTEHDSIIGAIWKTMFETARDEQVSNNNLAAAALNQRTQLANAAIEVSKRENRGDVGANELALILGQGDISSYNQKNATESIASSMMWSSIMSSITKGASGVLTGMF